MTKITQKGEEPFPNLPACVSLPEGHKIPPGASFHTGEDDKRCRVIKPSGERCNGTRMLAYGICAGHAGVGQVATDPASAAKLAATERTRRRNARLRLGISARRASSPAAAARLAAEERAQDFAEAIVHAPLDDAELGTLARQRAAISAIELLYPQVSASLDVALPQDAEGVQAMGWQEMQALAAQLLSDGDPAGERAA